MRKKVMREGVFTLNGEESNKGSYKSFYL